MREEDKSKEELLKDLRELRQKVHRLEYEVAKNEFDESKRDIEELERRNRLKKEEMKLKLKREKEELELRARREREELERKMKQEREELELRAKREREELELKSVRDYAAWVVYATPTILCGLAPDGITRFINPSCERITGYKANELLGHNWWQLLFPGEAYQQVDALYKAFKNGDVHEYEMTLVTKSGQKCTISYSSINRSKNGFLTEIVLVGVDVTARKRMEMQLEISEEKFRTLISNIPCAVCRYTYNGQWIVLHMSNYIQKISGYSAWDLIENRNMNYFDIIHSDDRIAVEHTIHMAMARREPYILEYRIRHADGSIRWLHEKGQACFDAKGQLQWLDSAIFDITDRKNMERKLEETLAEVKNLSLTDELTRLYNRRGFITHAEQQLKIAGRNRKPICILFCDLDGMKEINDNLGHDVGDQALILTSSLMRQTFRDADIVARLGGDEFAVLAVETDASQAERMRARLLKAVEDYNRKSGSAPFRLSISIGISTCTAQDLRSIDDLLKQADKKMYEEKRSKVE